MCVRFLQSCSRFPFISFRFFHVALVSGSDMSTHAHTHTFVFVFVTDFFFRSFHLRSQCLCNVFVRCVFPSTFTFDVQHIQHIYDCFVFVFRLALFFFFVFIFFTFSNDQITLLIRYNTGCMQCFLISPRMKIKTESSFVRSFVILRTELDWISSFSLAFISLVCLFVNLFV